jgi:hypothetical protein
LKQFLQTTDSMNGRDIFFVISVVTLRDAIPKRPNNGHDPECFFGKRNYIRSSSGALSFFRKYRPGSNNELEKTILALNNELQIMRTENEWRSDATSQGKSNSHDL